MGLGEREVVGGKESALFRTARSICGQCLGITHRQCPSPRGNPCLGSTLGKWEERKEKKKVEHPPKSFLLSLPFVLCAGAHA